jgi:hypothetical protein
MADVRFFKVTVLPGVLLANAFYLVESGTYAESYVTDDAGVAKSIGNSAMIAAVAGPLIAAQLAQMNRVERVANIAARDVLASANFNQLVLVVDATGDATVSSGSALYYFNNADNSFSKVAEYEAMDLVVTWAGISGRPVSAPALIDDAVNKRHAHANLAVLDKFSEDVGGAPVYNGLAIGGTPWGATDW